MCGTSDPADQLLVLHEGRLAADELVERCLGLLLAKAMDLATPSGSDRAVALLAARLRRATSRADGDAVREAIAVLDVEWSRTTAAERRRLVAEAVAAAGRATAMVPARIETPFNDASSDRSATPGRDARATRACIPASLIGHSSRAPVGAERDIEAPARN